MIKLNLEKTGDYEVWTWALIGMSVFVGMRFSAWDKSRSSEELAAAVVDLIGSGLLPAETKK